MLVLSRQRSEAIVIGECTEVTVEEIGADSVELTIFSPTFAQIYVGRDPNPIEVIVRLRLQEYLRLGDRISITVASIGEDKVRLAVDAPEEVSVHRKEVQERIDEERKASDES